MGKRGQITLFVILGIIVLGLVGTVVYVKGNILKSEWEKQAQKSTDVPVKAKPVKIFIDSCIETTAEQAITLVASQGGYIRFPETNYVRTEADPFSNSISLFSGGGTRIPYWYLQTADNKPKSYMPTLPQVENEISRYIELNLKECFNNFTDLKEQGYKITTGSLRVKTTIRENDILLIVDYPTTIVLDEFKFDNPAYYVKIDAKLGKLYDVAQKIIKAENEHTFLENLTLNAMAIYEDIPFTEMDFDCTPKVWSKQKVTSDLKTVLAVNLPDIKIAGTNYRMSKDYSYFFVWNVLGPNLINKYKDLKVNVIYSREWPIKLDVSNTQGDIMKADSTQQNILLGLFCINYYNFVYDVKYPVVFMITDDNSLKGQGLTFSFATQVVIDNNQPRQNKVDLPESVEAPIDFCGNPASEVTVYTYYDKADGSLKPLPNASLSFDCIFYKCELGYTDLDRNNEASLTTRIPPCYNGVLSGVKEGYRLGKTMLSSNDQNVATVILEPEFKKKVSIKIVPLESSTTTRNVNKNEEVIISFDNTEKQYSSSVIYPESSEITLVAGSYNVSEYVIYKSDKGIIIPKKDLRECVDVPSTGILAIFGGKKEECVEQTVEGGKYNEVVTGGAKFSFSVDREELEKADTIKFYVPNMNVPSSYEDMQQVYQSINSTSLPIFISLE